MSRTVLKTHNQLLEWLPCAKNSIVSEICGVVQGAASCTIVQISPWIIQDFRYVTCTTFSLVARGVCVVLVCTRVCVKHLLATCFGKWRIYMPMMHSLTTFYDASAWISFTCTRLLTFFFLINRSHNLPEWQGCTAEPSEGDERETRAPSPPHGGTVALSVGLLSSLLYSHSPDAREEWLQGFWTNTQSTFHWPPAGKLQQDAFRCSVTLHATRVPPPSLFWFLLGRRRTLRSSRDDGRREVFRKQSSGEAIGRRHSGRWSSSLPGPWLQSGAPGTRGWLNTWGLLALVSHTFQMSHTKALYPELTLNFKELLLLS